MGQWGSGHAPPGGMQWGMPMLGLYSVLYWPLTPAVPVQSPKTGILWLPLGAGTSAFEKVTFFIKQSKGESVAGCRSQARPG